MLSRAIQFIDRRLNSFIAISKVDSKGRITIPIGLRARLRLVEGSEVKIMLNTNRLTIVPFGYGQSGVRVSTDKGAKACGASDAGSSPASDLFNFKVYVFDLFNTLGFRKNGKIRLSKNAERLLQELKRKGIVRVLFTLAKREEIEKRVDELFEEVVSVDKKNTKSLEEIVKRLVRDGYKRTEICYVGDDFCDDFLPAMNCGLNVLLLRRIL